MIYLASPYTHEDLNVMELRYEEVLRIAGKMVSQGLPVYSPIIHFHNIAEVHELPRDAKFWWKLNRGMMDKADELWVLMMDGWMDSSGVEVERAYAANIDLEMKFVEPTLWLK